MKRSVRDREGTKARVVKVVGVLVDGVRHLQQSIDRPGVGGLAVQGVDAGADLSVVRSTIFGRVRGNGHALIDRSTVVATAGAAAWGERC